MRDFAANLRLLLASMSRQAGELRLPQTASSLTLLTLMAVVPMAAVALLVLTASPAFSTMRARVQRFVADNLFLPSFSQTVGPDGPPAASAPTSAMTRWTCSTVMSAPARPPMKERAGMRRGRPARAPRTSL